MPPPRIPFAPHANFRNLANLEALEKIQWCFHIWPFWRAKILRVIIYLMCSLAFSLFVPYWSVIVYSYSVCSVLTVQVPVYNLHIILVRVYVRVFFTCTSSRELIEYSSTSISTTKLRAHVNVRNSKLHTCTTYS